MEKILIHVFACLSLLKKNMIISLLALFSFITITSGKLYFTLNFDDAWDEHYDASILLDTYGFKGTFFANSGRSGTYEYMKHTKLIDMDKRGHEIGGHTVHHFNLTSLDDADREYEICQDVVNLKNWGLKVDNFAYPFGATFDGADELLKKCGYTSTRISGGLWTPHSCLNCQSGLRLPLKNSTLIRSISYRSFMHTNDVVTIIDRAIKSAVAQDLWLVFIFHRIANFTNDYSTYLYFNEYNPEDDLYNSTINIVLYEDMVNIFDYLKKKDVTVLTIRDMMLQQGFMTVAPATTSPPSTNASSDAIQLSLSVATIFLVAVFAVLL